MEKQYRHELKFLCGEGELRLLEQRIRHICSPDSHAGKNGDYVIRSLYFDTYDDQCFHENEAGIDRRKKYRIRIYNGQTDVIHLECKETVYDLKRKEACALTLPQCQQLINRQDVAEVLPGQELLERFLAVRRTQLLMPKVIVEYVRTPYVHAAGNVRITFDRDICSSPKTGRFLEPRMSGRRIMAQGIHILEVKYDESMPGAVRELLTMGQDLSRTSFSKYCESRKCAM